MVPSGNEIGPFKAIEESTISHLVPPADRSGIFAWYILLGTIGTAIGTVTSGWIVQYLQLHQGWTAQGAYRTIFWAYAALGLVKFLLVLMLGPDCEQEKTNPPTPVTHEETQPLLAGQDDPDGKDIKGSSLSFKSLLPTISRESSTLVFKLCLLFAIDSFASGLVPGSWISYFFNRKFSLAEGTIGTLFFISMLIASASNLAAPSLARRIGLIRAMVFTHVPASIALLLIPLPNNVIAAVAIFIFRSCFNSMDQPPRQALIAGAVLAEERTAVMGIVNVVKTLSQSLGPTFTGILAGIGKLWVAFVVAGGLKLLYDALMLAMFLSYRTREEQAALDINAVAEAIPTDAEEMANEGVSREHSSAV
jgi:MFS family permease